MMLTTKAGRALLNEIGWRVNVGPSIDLIEREAAEQERERIRREVAALPYATPGMDAILAEPSDQKAAAG